MNGRGRRAVVVTALIAAAAFAGPQRGASVLRPISPKQVMAARAAETGCSWYLPQDRCLRLAAADDRAVIGLATGITMLRPAVGTGDLFLFTT